MSECRKPTVVKTLPVKGRGPSSVTLVVAALVLALLSVMAIPVVDAFFGVAPSGPGHLEGE